MAHYEMPQSLKKRYQEKIEIGLISIPREYFKFFVLTLFICLLIITSKPINETVTYSLTLGIFGGSIYTMQYGSENLKTWWNFRKTPKNLGWFDSGLRKWLKVEKIENSTIFLDGGKMRAVLLTSYVNFDAMKPEQIGAFNQALSDFINSLDYQIQFTVRSVELNLETYWKWIESKLDGADPQKRAMYEDKKKHSQELADQESTTNKIYLTVIPFEMRGGLVSKARAVIGDEEKKALEELEIRVETARKFLMRAGVTTSRLDDGRLMSLLSGYFQRYGELDEDYLNYFSYPYFDDLEGLP